MLTIAVLRSLRSPRPPFLSPIIAANDAAPASARRLPAVPSASNPVHRLIAPAASAPMIEEKPAPAPARISEPDRLPVRVRELASFLAPSPAARSAPLTAFGAGTITRFVAELTLRGQLISADARPLEVEFALRRLVEPDGDIVGMVRFFQGEDRIASHRVQGKLRDRTLVLDELDEVWTKQPAPRMPVVVDRTYTIELPVDHATGEITGTWSTRYQKGTIASLRIMPPW